MKKIIASVVAGSLMLAGCSAEPNPCAEAENPAECRQWSDAGGDVSDYLLYGMAGYMIGSMMSGGQRVTYIHQDPSYRGTRPAAMRNRYGTRDAELARTNRRLERVERQQRADRERRAEQRRADQRRNANRSSSRPRPSFRGGGRRR